MLNKAKTAREKPFYHKNMTLLELLVDTTWQNEKMKVVKLQGEKQILLTQYKMINKKYFASVLMCI